MTLKPCPNCGVKESVAFSKDKPSQAYCINCGVAGPTADTPEEAELLRNLMPRKDDDKKSKYAMRIRVNVFETRKFADEERKLYIKGWIIGFGMSRNETYPIIEYDTGEILLLSFDLIEVDNG